MTKIDLNVPCIAPDGQPQDDINRVGDIVGVRTLASHLRDLLAVETEGDSMKLFAWYMKLQANDVLELDQKDLNELFDLIKTSKKMPLFIKGQVLLKLSEAK